MKKLVLVDEEALPAIQQIDPGARFGADLVDLAAQPLLLFEADVLNIPPDKVELYLRKVAADIRKHLDAMSPKKRIEMFILTNTNHVRAPSDEEMAKVGWYRLLPAIAAAAQEPPPPPS